MIRTLFRPTVLAAALAGFVSMAAPAAPLAVDFSGGQVFSTGVFNNIGWSFDVSSSVTVNGLGIFDVNPAGLTNRHQVGIWDSTNTLLAQTTVFNGATAVASASSLGEWLFEDIAALTLGPGSYVIGAFYANNDPDEVVANATGLALDSRISFVASRATPAASFGEPGPYGLVQPGVFGPNMRLATVPEPGSVALLGLALAALAASSRRRRG